MKLKDLKAKAPPIPDETCPLIDIVSFLVKDSKEDGEITMALLYLERIRAANAELRASSAYWYNVAKDLLEGE